VAEAGGAVEGRGQGRDDPRDGVDAADLVVVRVGDEERTVGRRNEETVRPVDLRREGGATVAALPWTPVPAYVSTRPVAASAR
jgi:hypothetical protein